MPENHCGTCTACCRVFAIPQLNKPAGKWCQHCTIGKCCNIYDERPQLCVEYECLWLQSQKTIKLEPELRPDRCKVVFTPTTNDRIILAITMEGMPDAWMKRGPSELIDRMLRSGISVAVGPPHAKRTLLIKPDGSRRWVEMTEPDENGMQWSKNYEGSA